MQIEKSQIRVVTVCDEPPTQSYYCYDEFLMSLSKQGVLPLILGKRPGEYNGLASKPKLLLKAIQDGWIKEEYIIFCDCFDLVFQADVEYVVQRFHEFNADVVISAEKNCFPNDHKSDFDAFWRDVAPTEYKYINSGFIVGRTASLRALLESMDLEHEPDDFVMPDGSVFHNNDQLLFQRAWTIQPVRIAIDVHCILSWCMMNVGMDEVGFRLHRMVYNKSTDQYPATLHWNGGSKTQGTMEPILKHLNLRSV